MRHWYCIMKLKQHGFAWKSCAQNLDAVEPQFSTWKWQNCVRNPPDSIRCQGGAAWINSNQFSNRIFGLVLHPKRPHDCRQSINTPVLGTVVVAGCISHRIHGAGIYANIGGILMGSRLPYIPAPWILWVLRCQIWCALKHPAIFVRWHSQSKFPRISHCYVWLLEGNKSNRAYHHILLTESGTDSMQATLR